MELGLTGKRAVVLGATRGIGRSIAECLAEEGCDVAICARDREAVTATMNALQRHGRRVTGQAVDVGRSDDLRHWIAAVSDELGGLDILVSNVSAQSFDWERSFAIDILACVQAVDAALPSLRRSRSGAIVAISSQAAVLSVPSYKPYSAMKAALISYMSSLSRELAPEGIRVNVVSPGEVFFEGGFWDRIRVEEPALFSRALEKNVCGRMARPDEVARAVAFLSSPAASFVSGTNLMVDFAGREHVQF